MRTDITAPEITLLESGAYAEHWRVKIANGDGTLIDVSDRLHAGTVNLPNPDATIGTATLEFRRELAVGATTSLAPLIDASTYNRLDDTVTISPLLDIGREATIEIAVTAIGAARPAGGSALWHEIIGGYVKQPAWPKRFGNVAVEIQDRAYALMRTHIETATEYAIGTLTETAIQDVLDDHMGAGVYALTVDDVASTGATGSALSATFEAEIQPVWDALQSLAASIGWVLWYRYNGAGAPILTLTEPRRAKAVADYTFTNAQIKDVVKLTVIEEDIRNVVVVDYVDVGGVQLTTTAEDATSISKYGGIRRYARLTEDETSPIRAAAQADELRDAMLSDLKDPDADMAIETIGAWWPGEPAVDLYAFSANTVMFDNAQTLAPYSISIAFSVGSLSSATVAVRGKPSGGSGRWLGRRPGEPASGIEALSLYGFQVLYDTPLVDQVTIQWTRGADVYEVWDYVKTVTVPVTEADRPYPLPDGGTAPSDVLAVGTDELVVDVPAASDITFVQIEARNADLAAKNVYRFEIHPKAVSTGADLPAGSVLAEALIKSAQTYGFDGTWGASSPTVATWGSGTLTFADGVSYSISSGTATGLTSAPTFIYFDASVSTVTLQTTTDWGSVVGDTAVLMALAWSGVVLANVVPGVGVLGLDGNAIRPLSIQTGTIAANAITAAKISVAFLSAIVADIGTITAGLLQDSTGNRFLDLDATGGDSFLQIDGTTQKTIIDANGNFAISSGVEGLNLFHDEIQSYVGVDFGFRIINDTLSMKMISAGDFWFVRPTEDFKIVDAGSAGATEQDWVEVKVGATTGYIRVYAAK